ncbi:MAG: histidinol-phosphatase [Acidimicrobiales bacterium]
MIDYHVHLWPHAQRAEASEQRLERLAVYCEQAAAEGVGEIALTEHFFRFTQGRAVVGDFWLEEPSSPFAATMAAYFDHHATADLDAYVTAAVEARAAGLPVVVGLEVDYYPGKMDAVARLLSGYPFDVLLGSVHWLGTWQFDLLHDEASLAEWDRRDVDEVWRRYTDALAELAGTRTCDVLAHPDFVKLAGRRPAAAALDECHERMAEAAWASGMAAEISSSGFGAPVGEQYPAPALLASFARRKVPVTTASDAHGPGRVGERAGELGRIAAAAGYTTLRAFRARRGHDVPLGLAAGAAGKTER